MTMLYVDSYNYSRETAEPTWMRQERFGYCEQTGSSASSFWKKLLSLFA